MSASDGYFGAPCVMPDPIVVMRDYLLACTEVVELVAGISIELPGEEQPEPWWPWLRITGLNVFEQHPRRIDRSYLQFDAYAETEGEASKLARTVRAALTAASQFVHPDAVVIAVDGTGLRSQPDDMFTPPMPRWVVTSYVYLRPNP